MREIKVRFERAEQLSHIDVLVRASEQDSQITDLMERIIGEPPETLTVTDTDGALCKLIVDDIVSASVVGKQTHLVTENASYTVRQTLQSLENLLDERKFVRISRYELVNLSKIQKYDFTIAGTLRLELVAGMETWASRRCIPAIRRRLNGKEEDAI